MNIGIAGVGGIGSNVAIILVRSGIDTLTLVDFDRVEAANLNRQFYFADQVGRLKVAMLAENLRRIRPGIAIETVVARLDAGNCGRSSPTVRWWSKAWTWRTTRKCCSKPWPPAAG